MPGSRRAPLAVAAAGALLPLGIGLVTEAIQQSARAPAPAVRPEIERAEVSTCNIDTLAACPPNGCAPEGSGHAALNELKRTIPEEASATELTFDDFRMLQTEAARIFPPKKGLEIPPADRRKLHDLNFSHGTISEGDLVQVVGFIVGDPHPNSGESVNCGLRGEANNDFHIPLGAEPPPAGTEFQGIVVEMIPQNRNPAWTVTKLADIQAKDLRVRVMGQLLYDSIHVPNDDPNHVVGGQPKRMSLWEVHPITQFLVCTKSGNACDPAKEGEWTLLEDYPKPAYTHALPSGSDAPIPVRTP